MIAKLTKLRCPRCSKRLGIPRKLAGKTFPCPKCGVTFSIAEDLSHLRPLSAAVEEEPIVAEVVEPPLAESVEKPKSSMFLWLVLLLGGGLTMVTLLIIAAVVLSLSSTSPKAPTSIEPPARTEPTAPDNAETSEPVEGFYDRTVAEPIEDGPSVAAQSQTDDAVMAEPAQDE